MSFSFLKSGFVAALLLGPFCGIAAAQTDQTTAVTKALNDYMLGSSYNNPERIKSAFYPEASMFLDHREKPIFLMDPEEYAALFAKREQGVFNGRFAKILDIDIEGQIATAKAEILVPGRDSRYIDIFLLKKLDGEWKIISKAAGRADSDRTGEKTLLIATGQGMGERFSDLIASYERAVGAGYTIDIVSPNGGAILFAGLNMGNPEHRKYIYNADFMYMLEHTLAAADVTASDYVSAGYICHKGVGKGKKKGSLSSTGVDKLYTDICKDETACAY